MTAQILDGRAVSAKILDRVSREVEEFVDATGRVPCLATVLVGDDPASHTYVRMKANRCAKVGMRSRTSPESYRALSATLMAELLLQKAVQPKPAPATHGELLAAAERWQRQALDWRRSTAWENALT